MVKQEGANVKLDYWERVASGDIDDYSPVLKFGRNATVPNGTWAFINQLGFTAWPLTAATKVRIKSGGNAADTYNGAGARSVFVNGIDSLGNEVTEEIATAGASASALTTALFWTIHRAYIGNVGARGVANTAAIVIENGTGGTNLISITADEGQSQFGGYTIPAGYKGILNSIVITVDGLKPADVRCFVRGNITTSAAPYPPKRLKLFYDGILGVFMYKPKSPILVVEALNSVWFEARGSGAITEVSVDFEMQLVRI